MVSAADRSTSRNRRIAAFSARECLACLPNLRHCQAETRQCPALRGKATAPAYPNCIDHCLIGRETETDDNDEKTSLCTLKAIVFIDKLAEGEGLTANSLAEGLRSTSVYIKKLTPAVAHRIGWLARMCQSHCASMSLPRTAHPDCHKPGERVCAHGGKTGAPIISGLRSSETQILAAPG